MWIIDLEIVIFGLGAGSISGSGPGVSSASRPPSLKLRRGPLNPSGVPTEPWRSRI